MLTPVQLWLLYGFSMNYKYLEQNGRKTKMYGTEQTTDSFAPKGIWGQAHSPRARDEQKPI